MLEKKIIPQHYIPPMDAFVFVETPEHVEAKHCQIEKAPDDLPCKCLTCNMLIDSIDDLPDSTGRMPSIPENSTRKNENGATKSANDDSSSSSVGSADSIGSTDVVDIVQPRQLNDDMIVQNVKEPPTRVTHPKERTAEEETEPDNWRYAVGFGFVAIAGFFFLTKKKNVI